MPDLLSARGSFHGQRQRKEEANPALVPAPKTAHRTFAKTDDRPCPGDRRRLNLVRGLASYCRSLLLSKSFPCQSQLRSQYRGGLECHTPFWASGSSRRVCLKSGL